METYLLDFYAGDLIRVGITFENSGYAVGVIFPSLSDKVENFFSQAHS